MIRIAIIEDLPIILEGIKVLINQVDDFEVKAEFRNGQQFLDHLPGLDIDIVLMDINMPVIDGTTATRMALASFPDLKIIALSMHNDQKYYYEMVTSGAKGFVLKQASMDELEKAIRTVQEGANFFSQELLHNVILKMQSIEKKIVEEKKEYFNLTERESHMLEYICQGMSNRELAEKLFVSVRTVESTKKRLMDKTMVKNTAGLIIWAIKNSIVSI